MKNILFLTISPFDSINRKGIYGDLVRELIKKGNNAYVVTPLERKLNLKTILIESENFHLLRVKTGNLIKCGIIEKGISTLLIESQFLKQINKYFKNIKFDLILYSTPPITFYKIVNSLKSKYNSLSYLMLKDIFPQNAVDLGALSENGILCKFFRRKERNLYNISDYIGCMSKGNAEYLLKHNPYLDKSKIEVFPNAILPKEILKNPEKNKTLLRKFKIPEDCVLFVYGGNLGKPQGIEFLIKVIDNFKNIIKGFLFILGSGTEFSKIKCHIEKYKPVNVILESFLPKEEYQQIILNADVGLIFLDKRFTIPNIPSRLTDYMEHYLPILAATDSTTDLKDIITESKSGLWSESGEIESFIINANKLTSDSELRKIMGSNSRNYLEENFNISKTINVLLDKL